MADLTVVTPARSANLFALESAAGGGDAFLNSAKRFLVIDNADGSPMTLTLVTQNTVDGEAVDDKTIVVAAGTRQLLGPFPPAIYNDNDDKVQLTYSAVTSLTVGVIDAT